jgi:hypothetical protein
VVAAVVVLLAGCAGGDDGDDTGAADTGSSTTTETGDGGGTDGETGGSLTTTAPATTPPSSTLPEGSVAVPVDDELVDRLPQISQGERAIDSDEAFDERLCDGTKAPAVPKSQARATYPISDSDVITVAAYRFASDDGAFYLASYADAVRACALEAGESEGLGLPDSLSSSFALTTERGDAFIAMALYEGVMWVLFQESTDGPVEVQQTTIDVFLRTIVG